MIFHLMVMLMHTLIGKQTHDSHRDIITYTYPFTKSKKITNDIINGI